MSDAVSCAVASSTSAHTTVAPASASRPAIARPSPRPAPVTMATLPVRSNACEIVVMDGSVHVDARTVPGDADAGE